MVLLESPFTSLPPGLYAKTLVTLHRFWMKMIPLERLILLGKPGTLSLAKKGNGHGEKEEEAGKIGSDFANVETECSGYRYGSDGSGGRSAGRSRFRIGADVCNVHARFACSGRLAAAMWHQQRRYGVHWCLLDSAVSDPGGSWHGGLFGQRSACASCAGAQVRCVGLSVAAVFAFGWIVESLVSTRTGHMCDPLVVEASGRSGSDGSRSCATYAEGAGPNECSDSSRH